MIFLDNASTTPVRKELIDVINHYNCDEFFNPSAPYNVSIKVNQDIENARQNIIKALNGDENAKIIFTGSATEANNTALIGQLNRRYKKVIISQGEHSSIFNTVHTLEMLGYTVVTLGLDATGKVDVEQLKKEMDGTVGIVSIMHVSNETGAINDIEQIVKIVKKVNPNCVVHCDGVQAFGKIKVNLKKLSVDMYTLSAHKINGPKGIAVLYSKQSIKPFILGGDQQSGMRAGTENVSGIMALSYLSGNLDLENKTKHIKKLNDICRQYLVSLHDDKIKINSSIDCSPYIISLSMSGVNGETLVHMLEQDEIYIGTGSACNSKKHHNRILESMGVGSDVQKASVRISFGVQNTESEVEYGIQKICDNYKKLYNQTGGKK